MANKEARELDELLTTKADDLFVMSEDGVTEELRKVKKSTALKDVNDTIAAHEARVDNPHVVTQDQVGLGNVDNTSDADKPISNALDTALSTKEPVNANIQEHIAKTDNPHHVTYAQLPDKPSGAITPHNHPLSEITDNGTMAAVDDAPSDGKEYGRKNGAWG